MIRTKQKKVYDFMSKKSFDNLNQLKREINSRINNSLRSNVSNYVVDKLKEHIDKDVYNSYTPVDYQRRKENDGLLDESNIRSKVISQELSVYEEAEIEGPRLRGEKFKNRDGLARLIENGAYNPWNNKSYKWTKPRKFISNTQKEINKNYSEILKILKDDIEHTK